MKLIVIRLLPLLFMLLGAFTKPSQSNIEFICMKRQMAPNHCHYNFIVDGGKFRFVDIGCRFKKKDEVIEKVKSGILALAKDWKIACPEKKERKESDGY